jgi:four helix bundle protein
LRLALCEVPFALCPLRYAHKELGYGRRRYKAEFIRFLIFAQASCDETTEWLEYIHDCYKDLKEEADYLLSMTDELGKKINRFIQAVESKHKV